MEFQIQDRAVQKIRVKAGENELEPFNMERIIGIPMTIGLDHQRRMHIVKREIIYISYLLLHSKSKTLKTTIDLAHNSVS